MDKESTHITIRFHHELRPLLHRGHRKNGLPELWVQPWASIKDVVESLQVPHTEIGELQVCGRPVDFSYRVSREDDIGVLPLMAPVDPCTPTLLRPEVFTGLKFMVDINVARLGALLRMAGIDTAYMPGLIDKEIAAVAMEQERILLSRNRELLKRKRVIHGHLLRSQHPGEQLIEVIHLYGLKECLQPFTRCMQCNGLLVRVEKKIIMDRLEPLTRKYYEIFYICPSCNKIYWSGSHRVGMEKSLEKLKCALKNTDTGAEYVEKQA